MNLPGDLCKSEGVGESWQGYIHIKRLCEPCRRPGYPLSFEVERVSGLQRPFVRATVYLDLAKGLRRAWVQETLGKPCFCYDNIWKFFCDIGLGIASLSCRLNFSGVLFLFLTTLSEQQPFPSHQKSINHFYFEGCMGLPPKPLSIKGLFPFLSFFLFFFLIYSTCPWKIPG